MWYAVNDTLAIKALYFNFLPSWWCRNEGLSFGRRFVFDPDYRVELHQFMARKVHERFPVLQIGSNDPQPGVIMPDFGNAITAAAAGCEVVYPEDNYPWNHHLAPEAIAKLEAPVDQSGVFPYCEIESQVRYLDAKLGADVQPVWNSRGVLNDAALIGGPEFFADFALHEPIGQRLIDYSYGMLTNVIRHNHERFGYSGLVMLTNCTIMMVNAHTYADRLLAYDQGVYELATGFGQDLGIHHCGSFERYAPSYRQIPRLTFLEIGWGSDPLAVLERFPEAYVQYIFSASFVSTATVCEVRDKVRELLERTRGHWHRFGLSMPDIEYGTPDENLVEIYECCKTAA